MSVSWQRTAASRGLAGSSKDGKEETRFQQIKERAAHYKEVGIERAAHYKEVKEEHAIWVAAEGRDLSMNQKLRRMVYAYGPLALGFHVVVEIATFGGFYYGVANGLDVEALLAAFESYTQISMAETITPGASNALVAYLLTTGVTGVPRTILTLTATPIIARKLGWRPKATTKAS